MSDQELAEQAFEVMASASGQVGQAYRLVEDLHQRILGHAVEVSEDAGRAMRPTLGSTGRACPDVRAATVSTMVHPRPSLQSLLDSFSHWVRLAQAQTGRSALALARRREDLTALQQQICAVRIERSAAAVLIDQAGDLRRALLGDHEHASEILGCLHVAARLIEQHVVDNVLFDPGAENGDELVSTVRTATEAATAMCGAINAAGHALTCTAASLASEEHLLSTARTSSGVCRRFLDAAAAAGDPAARWRRRRAHPTRGRTRPAAPAALPPDPRGFRASAARHLVRAVRLVLAVSPRWSPGSPPPTQQRQTESEGGARAPKPLSKKGNPSWKRTTFPTAGPTSARASTALRGRPRSTAKRPTLSHPAGSARSD